MFTQNERNHRSKLLSLFILGALCAPVEAVVYYGGYSYGDDGFTTYGGAAVVARPGRRRFRYYGRKLLGEDDARCETMLDVVESNPMLTSLKEVIKDLPRIRDALNNQTATDTFFAPSNEGIESFVKWGGYADFKKGLSEMFSRDEIKALVVAYHAVPDERLNWGQLRAKAAKGEFLPTALARLFTNSSAALEVSAWKGDIFVKGVGSEAKIVAADIPACGSVVHIIDGVLLPIDGDGELTPEQQARIERARDVLRGKDDEDDDDDDDDDESIAPSPAPEAAPGPTQADDIDLTVDELDEDYPMEEPSEAPAPAPSSD